MQHALLEHTESSQPDGPPPPFEPHRPRPGRLRFDWPLKPPPDPLWRAALEADAANGTPSAFASAWEELLRGELTLWCESIGLERVYLLARASTDAGSELQSLSASDTDLVRRILCGDSQKILAADMGVARSTVSNRCNRALQRLELESGNVPLPIVVAAQVWARVVRVHEGRGARFLYLGCDCVVLSIPRPVTAGIVDLTRSQREVAQLIVEGRSRWEIAQHRSTSANTVASQVHAIFAALRITGRHALIRRACELGCFDRRANK